MSQLGFLNESLRKICPIFSYYVGIILLPGLCSGVCQAVEVERQVSCVRALISLTLPL